MKTNYLKIMKIILITIAVIAFVFIAFRYPTVDFTVDSAEGIQFHKESWSEILELAKKENKLIFLDIYATWCGPCKKLKAKTFSDKEVGTFYNPAFINVTLDGENGKGVELAAKYGVRAYPTLLFINSNGNVVANTAGYHTAKELIELGETLKNKN